MNQLLFPQNIIAVIWDFDKTLIPGYMQEPLFKYYDILSKDFFDEVTALPDYFKKHGVNFISKETLYLNHIINYTKNGIFKGLNNNLLFNLGKDIVFYEGLPEFFKLIKDSIENNEEYKIHDIQVEHYIVSTGLRQMILGSKIASYVEDVWGMRIFRILSKARIYK